MACYRPRVAQQRADGKIGFYDQPGDVGALRIACGHCLGCQLDRASHWAIRCQHEASQWDRNCFVTLTYDDENVPVVPEGEVTEDRFVSSGVQTLWYPHVQLFLKKLRRRFSGDLPVPRQRLKMVDGEWQIAETLEYPIRFFAAGEYGSVSGRPHYHLLLFNFDFDDKRRIGARLSESASLSSLWKYGLASVGSLTAASAAYVSKYSLKKTYGRVESEIRYMGAAPEQVVMSRRPGIGASWYARYKSDVLPRDFVVVDNKKYPVPRYYLEKFKAESPEAFDNVVEERERASLARDPADRSFDRLAQAEVVTRSRLNLTSERGL